MKEQKYDILITRDSVIVISTFMNGIVRGVANYHPGDDRDKRKAEKIAKARCDAKIARMKVEYLEHHYTKDKKEELLKAYDIYEKARRNLARYLSGGKARS